MKITTIQDIHVNPTWIDESEYDIDRICEVSAAEKVDAICVAGDFFDRAIMATDKHSYSRILNLGKKLQDTAQVYYIYGTPSHDPEGIYAAFDAIGWKQIGIGKSETIGDLLIMGIPEITPAVISARFPELDKAEINAKQYGLVNQVIDEYYVPLSREWHNGGNKYVHFMLHGHVSGCRFKDEQKPRTTDFMFSEEMLSRIDADYYQAGHLHLPQSFKTIYGGYGGSSHLTWGDTGFEAGFDVIEYGNGFTTGGIRYSYNKPERRKYVIKNIADLDVMKMDLEVGVDTWIDIECSKEFADLFDTETSLKELNESVQLGPLSKITLNIQHEEHVRVDTEEYEACKTEEDLYKIYDPKATESILRKVNEIENATGRSNEKTEHHNFEFLDLYVRGSKAGLESGVEEVYINWEDFQTGVNFIVGENGKGKSFFLGFCTPYSEHLPTGIDFKSLFELKDSQIKRRFRDGDNIITQRILIDPVVANPTAKYYMDINGSTEAFPEVKGNKTPFDEAVNKLFGSIQMFMSCAFRGQDFNPKYPTLDKAKESDLRDIFTELSGVDRTPMKQYAHDKGVKISRDIDLIDREIDTLQGVVVDEDELEQEIQECKHGIANNKTELESYKSQGIKQQATIDEYNRLNQQNEGLNREIEKLEGEKHNIFYERENLNRKIAELGTLLQNAETLKDEFAEAKISRDEYYKLSSEYTEALTAHNNKVSAWQDKKDVIDKKLQDIATEAETKKAELSTLERNKINYDNDCERYQIEINHLNKPCEYCGKLPSDAEEKITGLNQSITDAMAMINQIGERITEINTDIADLRNKYADTRAGITEKPIEPESINELAHKANELSPYVDKASALESKVNSLAESESLREKLIAELTQKTERESEINSSIEQLKSNLNQVDNEAYESAQNELQQILQSITESNTEIGRLQAKIESLQNKLTENKAHLQTIENKRRDKAILQQDVSEWDTIEKAYSPKGIPALELSLIAPLIDREANRLLSVYGIRFRIEIITQDYDSKGNLAEKFKILVHDTLASEVKNLPVLSGGQRAWIVRALQEAISRISNDRSGRNWLYSIMDEADAPLDSDIIPVFYKMMNLATDGQRKLVSVTHSTEAKQLASSIFNITDFFRGE
jgi:DNA repair exonuclease SbcCD ATPase subunit/predicted MPP superfamily phosphohydrolase